jgi:hypothetical protein
LLGDEAVCSKYTTLELTYMPDADQENCLQPTSIAHLFRRWRIALESEGEYDTAIENVDCLVAKRDSGHLLSISLPLSTSGAYTAQTDMEATAYIVRQSI